MLSCVWRDVPLALAPQLLFKQCWGKVYKQWANGELESGPCSWGVPWSPAAVRSSRVLFSLLHLELRGGGVRSVEGWRVCCPEQRISLCLFTSTSKMPAIWWSGWMHLRVQYFLYFSALPLSDPQWAWSYVWSCNRHFCRQIAVRFILLCPLPRRADAHGFSFGQLIVALLRCLCFPRHRLVSLLRTSSAEDLSLGSHLEIAIQKWSGWSKLLICVFLLTNRGENGSKDGFLKICRIFLASFSLH